MTLNPHLRDAPSYVAGQPVSEALSPDRRTLLVLTSGYNRHSDAQGRRIEADSGEYVFVFDIGSGAPVQKQVLHVPNTYVGIAFDPSGKRFVVSGGGDDSLHIFDWDGNRWSANTHSPIKLNHRRGIGLGQPPMAEGVAVSADSAYAVVTNRYNASLSVVDLKQYRVLKDIELRPGKIDVSRAGTPGGEYPNAVVLAGGTAFIASERDREIDLVDLSVGRLTARIALEGNPTRLLLSRDARRLFVALDNADQVAVIDTAGHRIIARIPTVAPSGLLQLSKRYRGVSPDGLALSDDERTLYVANRGTNSIAVVALNGNPPHVTGLIPTGWYPSDVAFGPQRRLYVVNLESLPGPNRGNCYGQATPCPVKQSPVKFAPDQYVLNLTKGGLLSLPVPSAQALAALTRKVAVNNQFNVASADSAVMEALHQRIKHVIYIVKENRTYDQVLGDIGRGESDPQLAEFPQATTPNEHALANQFVLFDNFFCSGDVSGDGWPWSTSARESDDGAKMVPVWYAQRGGSFDYEGLNSGVNVGLAGAKRLAAQPQLSEGRGKSDPDVLPGSGDVAAPDGPNGERQQGYLWDAALRSGLTVRNYGFYIDLTRYSATLRFSLRHSAYLPLEPDPHATGLTVAYAANPTLTERTDGFFRGFDPAFPDTFREREWEREFKQFDANGQLPALSLVRLMNDHTGEFGLAINGVNTPERQVADNDYAVGKLVEAVAHSRYASDTLIFVIEDDAQDGADHVDAHRSIAFVVGPYVKQGALEHQRYTTVNMLRTITDVLGLEHLSLFDATQRPMSSIFDLNQSHWSYAAQVSGLLTAKDVTLGIPNGAARTALQPTHNAHYWAARTRGMDFDKEDRVDTNRYNRILWRGLMAAQPYPVRRGH
jgi:DNA-binding beta-propeller fold protein YncE